MIGTERGDSSVLVLSQERANALIGEDGHRPLDISSGFDPVGWGPDGEVLFIEFFSDGSSELRALDAGGTSPPRTVQRGATDASLSPNGRWLAFASEQGGDRTQVFVRAYPGAEEVRISTENGENPTWGPDGTEVYFVTERGQLFRVRLSFDGRLTASAPERVPLDVAVQNAWAHPDGRLLLDVTGRDRANLHVIRDWKSLAGDGS